MTRALFTYPSEYKTLEPYRAHSGQVVTIVRELIDGVEYEREDGERMYLVRADDGWTGHVWESELEIIS